MKRRDGPRWHMAWFWKLLAIAFIAGGSLTAMTVNAAEIDSAAAAEPAAVTVSDSVAAPQDSGGSGTYISDSESTDPGDGEVSAEVEDESLSEDSVRAAEISNTEEETSEFDSTDTIVEEALPSDSADTAVEEDYESAPADTAAADVIYLNGEKGSDDNDGTTEDTAVKSFAKARDLATANQSIKTIYVNGTVDINGEISLSGTNASLYRFGSFADYLLRVSGADSIATLRDILIDGNSQGGATPTKSLIKVENGATLNIEDGAVLQNNQIVIGERAYDAEGGAVYASEGTVNMTGGTIRNNRATLGGGILAEWSTLNMSGGTITNNSAVNGTNASTKADSFAMAAGGGIAALTTSSGQNTQTIVNLSGGTISNNSSDETGGGISLGYQITSDKVILNMTGGTIDGNSAGSSGGGIFVQASYTGKYAEANVSGGSITNNKLTGKKADGTDAVGNTGFGGGGIYVNGYNQAFHGSFDNGVLNLTNAIITENSAAYDGGGYASCPASDTHIYITDGAAFYANKAENNGDEIYILGDSNLQHFGAHYGSPLYTISPFMLGGNAYNWKYDYAEDIWETAKGKTGEEVSLNDLDGQLNGDTYEALALRTDNIANGRAQRLAKVIISGNTSVTRGGGIGSNGTVIIGKDPEDKTKVTVLKEWSTEITQKPENISINLYRYSSKDENQTKEYVGRFLLTPDEDGNWTAVFDELPTIAEDGGDYVYTVGEGDDSVYTYDVSDPTTKTSKITDDKTETETKFTVKNYQAVDAKPDVEKKLTGDTPSKDQTFTFTITADDASYPLPKDREGNDVRNATITGTGSVSFGTISFPHTGTYTYKVRESKENADGYTYDENEYQIVYVVAKDSENSEKLTVSMSVLKGDEVVLEDDDTVTFENAYRELAELVGTKLWANTDGIKLPESITLHLFANGVEEGSPVQVTAADGWKYSFGKVPVYDENGVPIVYSVSEDTMENYSFVQADPEKAEGTLTINVTNTYNKPEEPDTPDTPDEPVTPDTPDKPVTPEEPNAPAEPSVSNLTMVTSGVQTGDTMHAELFVIIAVIAIAGMTAAVVVSKRKKNTAGDNR